MIITKGSNYRYNYGKGAGCGPRKCAESCATSHRPRSGPISRKIQKIQMKMVVSSLKIIFI